MSAFPLRYCPMCGESVTMRRFEGRERAYCESCDEHIFHIPFPSAGVAVVDESRVCLLKRANDPYRGTWTIPGGIIEYDESPAAAATRELAEETGIEATSADCHIVTTRDFDPIDDVGSFKIVYAVPRASTTGEIETNHEASAVRFWNLDEFEKTDEQLRPGERPLVRRAISEVTSGE